MTGDCYLVVAPQTAMSLLGVVRQLSWSLVRGFEPRFHDGFTVLPDSTPGRHLILFRHPRMFVLFALNRPGAPEEKSTAPVCVTVSLRSYYGGIAFSKLPELWDKFNDATGVVIVEKNDV